MASAQERLNDFSAFLNDRGLKYTIENENALSLAFGGGDFSFSHVKIIVHFDDGGNSAHFLALDVAKAPEAKAANAMVACNTLNQNYRWVKWYVSDSRDIIVDADAVIDDSTASQECHEVVLRMVNIIDGAYPQVMSAIFS